MEDLMEDVREQILGLIERFQTVYLATVAGKAPRVRPVTLVHLGERMWVLTTTDDSKISELNNNPCFEACLPIGDNGGNNGYIRMAGQVEFVRDNETRRFVAGACDYFRKYWKSPEDPDFTLLRLQVEVFEYLRPGDDRATRYKV